MIRLLAVLVAGYAELLLVLFIFQSSLIFLPDVGGRALIAAPQRLGLRYHDVTIQTSDGEALNAWWVPHPQLRAALLFSRGNAGHVSHRLDSIRLVYVHAGFFLA